MLKLMDSGAKLTEFGFSALQLSSCVVFAKLINFSVFLFHYTQRDNNINYSYGYCLDYIINVCAMLSPELELNC